MSRYVVVPIGGKKPYAVKDADTNRIVGRSKTRSDAEASARARYLAIERKEK